ncbi:MAG TPA: UDP-3-O-(3-hydroxymyristoyl)glucosamine N-acyltransferase [Candidatus Margulisiibacteriota bacterium]|nr:UDP-3-O-(3-hydroxymyristoyl)glucosamine N-acyltransferase [Candidatus Margulisiibacteriota bacterium]
MRKTLQEIARAVGGEVVGDGDIVITGVSGIKEAQEGDITFLANPKYYPLLDKTHASAVVTSLEVSGSSKPLIRTDNPSLAFTKIISLVSPVETRHPKGIHPTVILGKGVSLGKGVAIGPYTVLEDRVSVGENSIIYPGCFIGHSTKIGSGCLIYPNVSIREEISIGDRVIIHCGTVLGADGFGYISIKGKHHKVPQMGTVEIGNDVEIGANVTVDRARFEKTVIGSGTKIDNLVQIAHNVIIGEDSIIVAQAGISGSDIIGKGVTIAGQAGLSGHLSVGDGATVAAQAGVTKSVPPNTVVSGYPARKHETAIKVNACVQNLPRLYDNVADLKKKIEELENKLKEK